MDRLESSPPLKEKKVSWVGLIWSLIITLWAFSIVLVFLAVKFGNPRITPDVDSLVTLLFGASSFGMIIFSLLVGGLAVLGWQTLRNEVKKDIEASVRARLDLLEKEVQGRANTTIGFTIGELHSNPDKLDQEEHKDYLSEAVLYCGKGYNILKDIPGNAKYMALNNLIYYSCLYGVGVERRDYFLEQAEVLKKIGQERDSIPALLTYCRVILQYGLTQDTTRSALSIAAALLARIDLTERQKKEAAFYVASLGKQLEKSKVS